jgi:hypothetical protein
MLSFFEFLDALPLSFVLLLMGWLLGLVGGLWLLGLAIMSSGYSVILTNDVKEVQSYEN